MYIFVLQPNECNQTIKNLYTCGSGRYTVHDQNERTILRREIRTVQMYIVVKISLLQVQSILYKLFAYLSVHGEMWNVKWILKKLTILDGLRLLRCWLEFDDRPLSLSTYWMKEKKIEYAFVDFSFLFSFILLLKLHGSINQGNCSSGMQYFVRICLEFFTTLGRNHQINDQETVGKSQKQYQARIWYRNKNIVRGRSG